MNTGIQSDLTGMVGCSKGAQVAQHDFFGAGGGGSLIAHRFCRRGLIAFDAGVLLRHDDGRHIVASRTASSVRMV